MLLWGDINLRATVILSAPRQELLPKGLRTKALWQLFLWRVDKITGTGITHFITLIKRINFTAISVTLKLQHHLLSLNTQVIDVWHFQSYYCLNLVQGCNTKRQNKPEWMEDTSSITSHGILADANRGVEWSGCTWNVPNFWALCGDLQYTTEYWLRRTEGSSEGAAHGMFRTSGLCVVIYKIQRNIGRGEQRGGVERLHMECSKLLGFVWWPTIYNRILAEANRGVEWRGCCTWNVPNFWALCGDLQFTGKLHERLLAKVNSEGLHMECSKFVFCGAKFAVMIALNSYHC